MYWNWQNVPESEHAELIAHIEAARWGEVAKVCERYGVSEYCCCNPEGLQSCVTVCRVEAGSEYSGTVRGERVKFWVSTPDKMLHCATLPIDSELIKIRAWETKA